MEDIKKMISEDRIKEALNKIENHLGDSPNWLVQISARLGDLMNEKNLGNLNYEDYTIQRNRLRDDLLNFLELEVSNGSFKSEAAAESDRKSDNGERSNKSHKYNIQAKNVQVVEGDSHNTTFN